MTAAEWLTEAQLYVFPFRAEKIAAQSQARQLDFIACVDFIYYDAVISGLADAIGYDNLQTLMAAIWGGQPEEEASSSELAGVA